MSSKRSVYFLTTESVYLFTPLSHYNIARVTPIPHVGVV